MPRPGRRALLPLAVASCIPVVFAPHVYAQQAYTWEQIRAKFRGTNPTLQAAQLNVSESRAGEITAYLRPNPDFSLTVDGLQVTPGAGGIWRPLSGLVQTPGISYLHERDHKRELRRDSARKSTDIAESTLADQERTLLFNLRGAFVQTLQQKAVLDVAHESLSYYDRLLGVSRERFRAGDIAEIDLDRLELQRAQFASDVINATTNLRTAKIQLLTLLNDRTPVDQFDVTGPFDFSERMTPLEEFRTAALANRPDLKAAIEAVDKARTDHQLAVANGSTDPTFGAWYSHNSSFANPFANETVGGSINIPLRIFDRNQGEKARTQIDIARNERLREAAEAQVFSDVDSAYANLGANVELLRLYKSDYLQRAVKVRETVSFAYQRGGLALVDFLQAQQDYRTIQLNYVTLIGAYLTAASQMNLAVGREVLP
jgi:cobalt-zinc-cadmium efflux system outer membrane protein